MLNNNHHIPIIIYQYINYKQEYLKILIKIEKNLYKDNLNIHFFN